MGYQVEPNVRSDRMMSPIEAAYFAGILDGEGSIFMSARKGRKRSHYFAGEIAVGNTSLVMLHWLIEHTGNGQITASSVRRYENQKQGYLWRVTPRQVKHLLPQVLAYLVVKRRQAEIVLRYFELQGIGRCPPSAIPEVLGLYAEIRKLNRIGLGKVRHTPEDLGFSLGEPPLPPDRRCNEDDCTDRAYRQEEFCYKHFILRRRRLVKVCLECGKEFEAFLERARLCSRYCQNQEYYKRLKAARSQATERQQAAT